MSLDRRMADESRLKAREVKKAKVWGRRLETSSREAGKLYSTHGSECSCAMCGNPRKFFGEKTIGERRQEQNDQI